MDMSKQDIIGERGTMPLVSICCTTYNHQDYIAKCLDSFVMQKTNFPFEILVHDDASTDNTAKIVREYELKYPHLFRCVYQSENQFYNQNALTDVLFKISMGKYIALCEGDDYWIDPLKLQKQVDFLESNPDYGMVHTDYHRYYTVTGKWLHNRMHEAYKDNLDILSGNVLESFLSHKAMAWTGTVCFRKEFFFRADFKKVANQNFLIGDLPMWCWIAAHSKIKYLDESTAVRQILAKSMTQGGDLDEYLKLYNIELDIIKFFVKIFELNEKILTDAKLLYYTRYLDSYFSMKNKRKFISKLDEYKKEGFTLTFKIRMMRLAMQISIVYWLWSKMIFFRSRLKCFLKSVNLVKQSL